MKFQASGTVPADLPGITRGSPSRPERARASRAAGLTDSAGDPPGTAVAAHATASRAHAPAHQSRPASGASHLNLERFDLKGYVLDTSYTLGRNTGNTFQQTYGHSMVQGVPIKGPLVGTKFPPEDYVAIPIGHHELYVTWLNPVTFAIVDAFVMDFAHHTVYDYAPGSDHPESAGRLLSCTGAQPAPMI